MTKRTILYQHPRPTPHRRQRMRLGSILACRYLLITLIFGVVAVCTGAPFDSLEEMPLIDRIVCANDDSHPFAEYPEGASHMETLLGVPCRILAPAEESPKYFAYKIGGGGRLTAGKAYLLHITYPDDLPRSMFILNRGCETQRGFHTGNTVGDALHPPYISSNAESLELPLTHRVQAWQSVFFLHDRFPGLKQPRDQEYPRDNLPEDGFWVIIAQLGRKNAPMSHGAAVHEIRLYEIEDPEALTAEIPRLPAGLPQRHVFFREEMSDGVIQATDLQERGVELDRTWYEQKIRLSKILGMNTFTKDLLELGANQGWDPSKYGGNDWVYFAGEKRNRWSEIVQLCGKHGLQVLPYYEYCGSKGGGAQALGVQRRARPLGERTDYTHIAWTEAANADLTDPETFEDLRKMLEITIVDESQKARFAGAWLRPRPSQLPISFSAAALARFSKSRGVEELITRAALAEQPALYADYHDWWMDQRLQFLRRVHAYLEEAVGSPQAILYTTDASEAGISLRGPDAPEVVAENVEAWTDHPVRTAPLRAVIDQQLHFEALTSPHPTWGGWEWQHAVPEADPNAYTSERGIALTYTFNRLYTVAAPRPFDSFRSEAGLAAIRHFSLNEDVFAKDDDKRILGYFVADVEPAGPYSMMAEALAMANGDPRFLGYLASSSFNTGFPVYMRAFHQNFLALPALPSRRADQLAEQAELAIRLIETESHGCYIAVVYTGRTSAEGLAFRLPEPGRLFDAVTGEEIEVSDSGRVELSCYPFQLRSFRFFSATGSFAPEIDIQAPIRPLQWHAKPEPTEIVATVTAQITDWDAAPEEAAVVEWTIRPDSHASILVTDRTNAVASIHAPGAYKVSVSATDGTGNRAVASANIQVVQQEDRIVVTPDMLREECSWSGGCNLFDEQELVGEPPAGMPKSLWANTEWRYPLAVTLDFGFPIQVTRALWFDANGIGSFRISTGAPGQWTEAAMLETDQYQTWRTTPIEAPTRYLRLEMLDGGANITEMAIYGIW